LSLGGNVRKGERGTTVVYADRFIPDEERKRAERDGDEPGAIPFLKRFTVFNTDQCENLPDEPVTARPPVPEGLILPQAEALIAATGADFHIGGDRAFYSPAQDYVQVPRPDAYFEPVSWHRTALHELGHNAAFRIMPHDRSNCPSSREPDLTDIGIKRRSLSDTLRCQFRINLVHRKAGSVLQPQRNHCDITRRDGRSGRPRGRWLQPHRQRFV
jgi:hypothetical protein